MKRYSKWFAATLMVAGSLTICGSAMAQSVINFSTIDPSSLTISPNALYPNWDSAIITSTATGLEVSSGGYGSLYFVVPSPQTLNTADSIVTLTFTVNSPGVNNINWMGSPFILHDNTGGSGSTYGGYSASGNPGSDPGTVWNGNVVTMTETLSAGQLAATQLGGNAIYSFNLQIDPASFVGPPVYDITFNSLVLSAATPTPEPASLALVGLGATGLFYFRRRK